MINRVVEKIKAEKSEVKACQIDLFTTRKEEDFYLTLTKEILKVTSSKWYDILQNAKTFLSRLMPQITFSPDMQNELSFGLEWEEIKRNPNEILDLAESIAVEKKIRIVICIDEFQNIGIFENSIAFQKRLRAHWQRHQSVSYRLYGSKRHMLLDVFTNSSMPFYKFGDLMFLEKIDTDHWIRFIKKRFEDTGKTINTAEAQTIVSLADNHSYYVQQLAQQVWLWTPANCNIEIIKIVHDNLVNQLNLLFINIQDPMFSYWLRKYYFKM